MIFKNRHIHHILFLYLLFFFHTVLFGQEEAKDSKTVFYIRDINFDVKGRSRPFALIYHGEFKEGEELTGEAALETYIKNKTQLLLNQRTLEAVEIEAAQGDPEADGRTPVDLLVKAVDTWNIIALPYPKFDSNSGFEIIIKGRDYNFLGTMSPLRLDLGYEHRESDGQAVPVRNIFKFEIDSDTPFRALGLNWNIDFDHLFSYTFLTNDEGFLSYKNISGFSAEFPFRRTEITVGFEQSFIINEINPDRYKAEFGDYAAFYMASKLYASWRIPLGITFYNFGELTYTPELSGQMNYRPGDELEFWRKGPSAVFSHRLGFGRIDWIGNFRSGLEVYLKNSNTYNFHSAGWDINYSVSVTAHKPFTKRFGISGMLQFRQWFFLDTADDSRYFSYTEVGDALRGVLDRTLIAKHGNFMISLNLDFPFRVLHFVPSEWLHSRKLRFFDFDLHIVPFIDMSLLEGSKVKWGDAGVVAEETNEPFPLAAGLEIIVFPAFMRSLYLRASFGYNINEFLRNGKPSKFYGDELFIGMGHHY